jgi:membrane-bound ClpP family serine protease
VDGLLDAPAFVVVAMTGAALLLLLEAALPTFGLAGISGTALVVAGAAAVARQDDAWWPLILCAIAVCLWAVLLVRRDSPPVAQMVACGLFLVGGVGYGIATRDGLAVATGALAALGLGAAYPPLLRATGRLLDLPPQMGMEALVGRCAVVEMASGISGTVRLDGSLWNARSTFGELPPRGATVLVDGYDGMMLCVRPPRVTDRVRS